MTAWWQMTSTFPCLSNSIITGSSLWTRSWYDYRKRGNTERQEERRNGFLRSHQDRDRKQNSSHVTVAGKRRLPRRLGIGNDICPDLSWRIHQDASPLSCRTTCPHKHPEKKEINRNKQLTKHVCIYDLFKILTCKLLVLLLNICNIKDGKVLVSF